MASTKLSGSSTPVLDSRILLSHILGISKEQLLIKYNEEIDLPIEQKLWHLVQRRFNKEPIAYIVGKQEFYGREYFVNQHVLIPRSETELLIDQVIADHLSNHNHFDQNVDILELGVGSGAVSISLAKEIPEARIFAVDICSNALNVAKQNVTNHDLSKRIELKKSDWYSGVPEIKFDYIVSNPPYISYAEKELVCPSTDLFEPKLALYAEDQGLSAYSVIIESANQYLKKDGTLFLEIGYNQRHAVQDLAMQNGFNNTYVYQDLADHDRLIICKL